MSDTNKYIVSNSGDEQIDGVYITSSNPWLLREFTTITIEGITYTVRDDSKLPLPINEGESGQVLSKVGDGTEWITVKYSDISDTPDLSIYATKADTAELSYTAFEVYPHTEILTEFSEPVEAGTIHALTFRSEQDNDQMDIIVDWGDGYKTTVADITHTGNEGDYRYYVSHDYATTGKFIVKITGKAYFGIIPDYQTNKNLVSRIFDLDLPIADHLRNYANMGMGAKCLSKVNVFNSNLNKNAVNISNLFAYCTNLTEAVGFSSSNDLQAVLNVFLDCVNLVNTDFRLPGKIDGTSDQEYYAVFDNCSRLAKDINSLLPRNGFYGKNRINLGYTFRNCSSLTGTVPAKLLWEDKTVDWVGVPDNSGVGPFVGCSAELRAQIPVSWGGTNSFIDYRKDVSEETDYTAFEVYPNSAAVEAGKHGDLGTIKEGFRNQVAMYFNLVSDKAQADQNVYIDWGDGCIIKLSELAATTYAEGKAAGHFTWAIVTADGESYNYAIYHNYEAGKQNKRLIVKIYGNTYSNLNFNASSINQNKNNLICRIFDKDLPVASHLTDLSGMCMYAVRLVSVDLDFVLSNIHRFIVTDLFTGCTNLAKLCGSFDLTEADYTALGLTSMPDSYAMSQAINYVDDAVRLIDSLKADKEDVTELQEILGTLNTELDEVLTELEQADDT